MIIGNLTQLSLRPGMPSEPTLRKIIARHPDFPIIRRGKGGRGYEIDLEHAEEFILQLKKRRVMEPIERLKMARQLGLTMLEAKIKAEGCDDA